MPVSVRNQAPPIILSAEERTQLAAYAASRSLPHALVTRARVIVLAAQGETNLAIAKAVRLSRESVGKWRRRYAAHGNP